MLECKYCDTGFPTRPYGMDDVAVCGGCGAEWDPIFVKRTDDELREESHQKHAL